MQVTIFVLNKEEKRRLIELMILIFSVIVGLTSDKVFFVPSLFWLLPFFLLLSTFCWIALEEKDTCKRCGFRFLSLIISAIFPGVLSGMLLISLDKYGVFGEAVFWLYYIIFALVIYLALITKKSQIKFKGKLNFKWKLLVAGLLIISSFILAYFF